MNLIDVVLVALEENVLFDKAGGIPVRLAEVCHFSLPPWTSIILALSFAVLLVTWFFAALMTTLISGAFWLGALSCCHPSLLDIRLVSSSLLLLVSVFTI